MVARSSLLTLWLVSALALQLCVVPAHATPVASSSTTTERVSVAFDGAESDDGSGQSSVSACGRYVAFVSWGSNLVPDDTNGAPDVFVRDLLAGTTERVSIATSGAQGNGDSFHPSISACGRYVAFYSDASNLTPGDDNGAYDVFVHDRQTRSTELISVATDGTQANGWSRHPAISACGRYVAFDSWASNLVPLDTNGTIGDVFVRDRYAGTTELISISTDGRQGNGGADASISACGRYVAFGSGSDSLVPGVTNGMSQVFIRDRQTGATELISVATTNGNGGNNWSNAPSVSACGRYVAFCSDASNLMPGDTNETYDIFLRDRQARTTERISVGVDGVQGNHWSGAPSISACGRFVAFDSRAPNLVSGDTNGTDDVFVRDRHAYTTERISVATDGAEGNHWSHAPSISACGRFVTFGSLASNLVPDDKNYWEDIFVHDTGTNRLGVINVAGRTRIMTAIEASRIAFPDGASTVVIATGMNWPDALGGTSLAGTVDGPILLVDGAQVSEAVLSEVSRLGAKRAYILGGYAAVSAHVEMAVRYSIGSAGVTRLAGSNRYATANLIAKQVIALQGDSYSGKAVVATGGNFPDALAVAPIASAGKWPLFLADSTKGITSDTKSAMKGVDEVVIVGGKVVVSDKVESGLKTTYPGKVTRVAGSNRYDTAARVAAYGVNSAGLGLGWDRVGITTGANFPDALAGGVAQGKANSVMLLTPPTKLDPYAASALKANKDLISTVTYFGGDSAVGGPVKASVSTALK